MSDPAGTQSSDQEAAPRSELCDEISRSIGTIWRENGGGRPSITTKVRGDRVRCVVTVNAEEPDADADDTEDDGIERSTDSVRYRNNVMRAIGKSTRRRVLAYIPKLDKETNVRTEIFIVDRSLGRQG